MTVRPGKLPPIQVAQTRAGRLCYIVSGLDAPGIVLVNGAGMSLEGWRCLYPRIESIGKVFAWNRPGIKGSDPPAIPQTSAAVVAALRELLRYAGMEPPYILVAHSVGGLHANLFARLYPDEVRAMLLLEATHPDDKAAIRRNEGLFAKGVATVMALPQKLLRANLRSEVACLDETTREIANAGPFPDVPLLVVTGGKAPPAWMMSPAATGARRANQQDLARLSARGEQVIAHGSGHFPQLTEPQLVLALLERLALT